MYLVLELFLGKLALRQSLNEGLKVIVLFHAFDQLEGVFVQVLAAGAGEIPDEGVVLNDLPGAERSTCPDGSNRGRR